MMRSKERKRAVSGSDGEDGVLPVQHRKRAIDIMERRIAGLMGEISLLHNSLLKLRKRHQELEAQNGMLQEQELASGSLHGSVNDTTIQQVLAQSATATSHGDDSDLATGMHFMYPNVAGQMTPVGTDGSQPMPSSAANATNTSTQTADIIHGSFPTSQVPFRQDNSNQPMDDSLTLGCDFWDNLMFENDQLEPNSAHTARFTSLAPSPRCQSQGILNYLSPSLSAAITLQSPTSEVASPDIRAAATPGSSLPHTSSVLHSPLAPLACTSHTAHQPLPYSPPTQLPANCPLSSPPQPPPTSASPSLAFAPMQAPHANHPDYPAPSAGTSPGYVSSYLSYQPQIPTQQQPLEQFPGQWNPQAALNATAHGPVIQQQQPPQTPSLGMMSSPSDAIPLIVPSVRPTSGPGPERSPTDNSSGTGTAAHPTWLFPAPDGSMAGGGWGAAAQQQQQAVMYTHQHCQPSPPGAIPRTSSFPWQPSAGDTTQAGGEQCTAPDNSYDAMCTVQPLQPLPVPLPPPPPPNTSASPAFLPESGFWYKQRWCRSNSGGGSVGATPLEEGTGHRGDVSGTGGAVWGASLTHFANTLTGGGPPPAILQGEGVGSSVGGGDVMTGVVHGGVCGALPSPSVAGSASGSAAGPGVGFTAGQAATVAGVPPDPFTPATGMVGPLAGVHGVHTATGEKGYSPASNATAVLAQLQLSPTLSAGVSAGVTAPPGTEQLRSPSSGGAVAAVVMGLGGSYEHGAGGPHQAAVHRSPALEQRSADSPGGRTVTSRPRSAAFGGGALMSPLGAPAAPYGTSRLAPYGPPYTRSNPYGLHTYPVQHAGAPPPAGQPLCWRRVRVRDRMPLSQYPANAVHSHLSLQPPLSGMVAGPPPLQPVLHKYYGLPAPRLPYPAVTSYGPAAGLYTQPPMPPLPQDPYRTQAQGAQDAAGGMPYSLPGSSSVAPAGGLSLPRAGSNSDYLAAWSTEAVVRSAEDGMGS